MMKHLITLYPKGFRCSCGETYDASDQSLLRRPKRPVAVASEHRLAALVQEAVKGGNSIVSNCLACNGESIIPAVREDTVAGYATWLRTPCSFCGKTPAEVAAEARR